MPLRLRGLVLAALMAGAAALLQTAPVWWGEPIGLLLAMTACLPLAVAALASPRDAILGYVVAVFLCLLIQPEEAYVLGMTNGPLGVALGAFLRDGRPLIGAVPLVAAVLFAGLLLLTGVIGFAPLGPQVADLGPGVSLFVYAGFALIWSTLWAGLVRLLQGRLSPYL